jgi:hypothetical protein
MSRVVKAFWVVALYLMVVYVSFRWGHVSPRRFPGSD